MHSLDDFQQDMRRSYLWGATGIMTSGTVWLAAAFLGAGIELVFGTVLLVAKRRVA